MASDQEAVQAVQEELEQRGARAVHVEGDISLAAFGAEGEASQASATVEYDGDPETVRNAVREMDRVRVQRVDDETWPGGDTHVTAEVVVLEVGSGGSNPGGNAARTGTQRTSATSGPAVPPPVENEATQDPHVLPGGTWAIEDENGIADEYEVEVWPVRIWTPRPGVDAITALRYIPHPAAEGMEWWTGYVRLLEAADAEGLMDEALAALAPRTGRVGTDAPAVSYHDSSGWVGWNHGDLKDEVDHHTAAAATEALAQAALEARREVLR